jgi:S-methylmethionine-dependent homocysteine/selenocysteine methylase
MHASGAPRRGAGEAIPGGAGRGAAPRDARGALRERLRAGPPILLDGALGTELERRGAPAAIPLWSTHALLFRPELVCAIHAEYVRAGTELLTANTFRTQHRTLARAGLAAQAARLCALAVHLARQAIGDRAAAHPVWVAGSDPPLEDCFRPDLVPCEAVLEVEHAAHARNLAAAGADLILCETHNCVREARVAVRAARETGLPVLASFVCGSQARLLSGEPLVRGVEAVARAGAAAVLVNCLPIADVTPCLPVLATGGLPFGVYANLGAPATPEGTGWQADAPPAVFAQAGTAWADAGARLVGGCCGTQPAHIRALADRLARGADGVAR